MPVYTYSDSSGDESTDVGWDCESDVSVDANDSLYMPTPERPIQIKVKLPKRLSFMDLSQLEKFVGSINNIRSCNTPRCKGALTPICVKSVGLGGAISITHACNGCGLKCAGFETSAKYELGNTTEISKCVQVASFLLGALTPPTLRH